MARPRRLRPPASAGRGPRRRGLAPTTAPRLDAMLSKGSRTPRLRAASPHPAATQSGGGADPALCACRGLPALAPPGLPGGVRPVALRPPQCGPLARPHDLFHRGRRPDVLSGEDRAMNARDGAAVPRPALREARDRPGQNASGPGRTGAPARPPSSAVSGRARQTRWSRPWSETACRAKRSSARRSGRAGPPMTRPDANRCGRQSPRSRLPRQLEALKKRILRSPV